MFGAWVSCPALHRDYLCSWVGVHCEVCRTTGSAQCNVDPWVLVSSFSLQRVGARGGPHSRSCGKLTLVTMGMWGTSLQL